MGLTLEDVRNVLTNVTVDDPKGSIDGPHQSYTIYANDQLTTAAPYNNVIIGYRNGAPIRIRDIGRAVPGPQNRELAAWTNGKRSILLLVFKQPNANVISTADGVKAQPATLAGRHSTRHPPQRGVGPHADHPRLGQRRRVHPDARRSAWS